MNKAVGYVQVNGRQVVQKSDPVRIDNWVHRCISLATAVNEKIDDLESRLSRVLDEPPEKEECDTRAAGGGSQIAEDLIVLFRIIERGCFSVDSIRRRLDLKDCSGDGDGEEV